MADFNALEAQLSDRQPNTPHYLCELNNKAGRGQTDAGQEAGIPYQGITCTKCGSPVTNYDMGSQAYQEYYGKCLPAICEDCLDEISLKVQRHNWRD